MTQKRNEEHLASQKQADAQSAAKSAEPRTNPEETDQFPRLVGVAEIYNFHPVEVCFED